MLYSVFDNSRQDIRELFQNLEKDEKIVSVIKMYFGYKAYYQTETDLSLEEFDKLFDEYSDDIKNTDQAVNVLDLFDVPE